MRDEPRISLLVEPNRLYLLATVTLLSLGNLCTGYAVIVLSPASFHLYEEIPATTAEKETIAAVFPLGAMCGCLIASVISDRLGRRVGLSAGSMTAALSAILMSQAESCAVLIASRFFSGVSAGLICSIGPVYIAETVPPQYRGASLAALGLLWSAGQILSLLAALGLGNRWRLLVGLAGFPAIVQVVALWKYVSESPRWLFQSAKDSDALFAMQRFYYGSDSDKSRYLESEVAGIRCEIDSIGRSSLRDRLAEIGSTHRADMLGVCGFMVGFSAGGSAAVALYSAQITAAAGFGDSAISSALGLFTVSAVASCVAVRVIDGIGRRKLLLSTLPMQAIATLGVAYGMYSAGESLTSKWFCLSGLLLYLILLGFASGPMIGLLASELFPLHLRGIANSIGNAVNWGSSAVIGFIFLQCIENDAGKVAVWVFAAAVNLACAALIYVWLPETRGKTLEAATKTSLKRGESSIELKEV